MGVGHGSGANRPPRTWPDSSPARITASPTRNTRWTRGRPGVRIGGTAPGRGSNSASPPTSTRHTVAAATATHSRSARSGCSIRVRCHCHPPRLMTLNPCSIQLRNAYQRGSDAGAGRSVRTSQASAQPATRPANNVHPGGAVR